MDKHLKNKQKQLKTKEQKQVDVLKSLESSEKQLPAIKDFISKERLNPEFMSELERSEDEEKKLIEVIWYIKDMIKRTIFETLKEYMLLVMILKLILLIWQTINKTIWQSTLKNLKVRQDHNIILTWKSKRRRIK